MKTLLLLLVTVVGHWTYPGSIDWHLKTHHGVNVAGMSHEQMLNMHDAIHEGRNLPTTKHRRRWFR